MKKFKFCDLCGDSVQSIEVHLANMHGRDVPGFCTICKKDVEV